jgi:tetratricopeptide (TPR) repeat protein
MRNNRQPLASSGSEHGPGRLSAEENVLPFGAEITRALRQHQHEIERWSQAAGKLVQVEIERAVVQGLAAAFRTLADQLPHLLAEAHPDAAPTTEEAPSLSILAPGNPANRDEGEAPRCLRIPLDEPEIFEETAEHPALSEATAPDLPALSPTSARAVPDSVETAVSHFRRGREASHAGDLEGAVAHFTAALRLDPNNAVLYVTRGRLLRRLGRTRESLTDVSQALQLDPRLAAAYYLRASAYTRQGKNQEAIADLTRFLELQPDHALAHCARGLAYANQGDPESAIADLGRALRLQPGLLLARYHRAIAYRLKGEHVLADLEFSKLIQLRPAFAPAYFNRALARLARQKYDRAIEDFDKAIELAPQDEEVRARREKALEAWEEFRAAKPPAEPQPAEQSPQTPPPLAPHSAEVENPDPTLLVLNCPECGAAARISWKRLDRLFRCRKCTRVFHVNREGHFTAVDPNPVASRRSWCLKSVLVPVAALLVILALGLWLYPRFHRRPTLPELPTDLASRGELWGKAWLNNDRSLLRRLTSPSFDRQLHPWLERHRPPASGADSSPDPQPPVIQLRTLKPKPHEAVVVVRIMAHALKTPAEFRLNWIEKGQTWYFVPSSKR